MVGGRDGLLYLLFGLFAGISGPIFPAASYLSDSEIGNSLLDICDLSAPAHEEAWSYNVLLRLL
jgi:hypothetical protein